MRQPVRLRRTRPSPSGSVAVDLEITTDGNDADLPAVQSSGGVGDPRRTRKDLRFGNWLAACSALIQRDSKRCGGIDQAQFCPVRDSLRGFTQNWFEFPFLCEVIPQSFLGSFEHHLAAAIGRQSLRLLRDNRATALAVKNRTIVNHG